MLTLLLVVIYLSFISLGLPDALLGSAWPVMNQVLEVPLSYAGAVSMIVSAGTIVSSILSGRLIRRFGTGLLTAVSVAMTAAALLGFAAAPGFWFLCVMAVPLGLGAGAVDAALNNFVALHYGALHMNWLHCFWGVGATLGPYIMSVSLTGPGSWPAGYRTVGLIQVGLVIVLFASLPLWRRVGASVSGNSEQAGDDAPSYLEVLRLPYIKPALASYFCYCAVEVTAGLWGGSYLVIAKGIDATTAARWVSMYYLGITAGRFASGFLSIRLSNKTMVRIGLGVAVAGAVLLVASPLTALLPVGLILVGLGCAPIYPALLHDTPARFGKRNAQTLMGLQMASAYVGSTLMPPLFGLFASAVTPGLLPPYLLAVLALHIWTTEHVNRGLAKNAPAAEAPDDNE